MNEELGTRACLSPPEFTISPGGSTPPLIRSGCSALRRCALNYPEIFACLGMVVGLYGLIYFEVARRPEQAGSSPAWGCSERYSARSAWPNDLTRHLADGDDRHVPDPNDLIWWAPVCALSVRRSPLHRRETALTAANDRRQAFTKARGNATRD